MLRKLVLLGLSAGWLLGAAEAAQEKVEIRKTERFDFAGGGVLQFINSVGDLTVEAWDEPQVEITTTKSSRDEVPAGDREKMAALLERVTVKAEKQGNELVITSDFPRHDGFTPTFRNGESLLQHRSLKFELEYRIRAPRNTQIVVHHDQGQVTIDGITGDIDATVLGGNLLLHLPEEAQYTIHAKSDLGHVNSDYAGEQKRRLWFLGHQVRSDGPPAEHSLNLRIGFGDIIILKTRTPPTPAPLNPATEGTDE